MRSLMRLCDVLKIEVDALFLSEPRQDSQLHLTLGPAISRHEGHHADLSLFSDVFSPRFLLRPEKTEFREAWSAPTENEGVDRSNAISTFHPREETCLKITAFSQSCALRMLRPLHAM